jgi:hypothetical protein
MGESSHGLRLPKGVTLGVGELIHSNQDEVNQPPDPATAECPQFEDSQSDVPEIETVHAEAPNEERKEERHKPFLLLASPEPHAALDAYFGCRHRLGAAGLAEASTLQRPLTAGHTKLGIVGKLVRAISAVHHFHLLIDRIQTSGCSNL